MISAACLAVTPTAEEASRGRRELLIWLPVLVILLLLVYGGYSLFKRWMNAPDSSQGAQGFSLSDLRAMHKAGKISDEEFEKTRALMVASARRTVAEVRDIRPRKPGPMDPPAE